MDKVITGSNIFCAVKHYLDEVYNGDVVTYPPLLKSRIAWSACSVVSLPLIVGELIDENGKVTKITF